VQGSFVAHYRRCKPTNRTPTEYPLELYSWAKKNGTSRSATVFRSIDPFARPALGAAASAGAQDVDSAVAAAREAFEGPGRALWRRAADAVRVVDDLIERDAERLATIETPTTAS